MSFRFNFSLNENVDSELSKESEKFTAEESVPHLPCDYISSSDIILKDVFTTSFNHVDCCPFELKYISQKTIEDDVKQLSVLKDQSSDLLPGIYEGGLKVWECSLDLARYLAKNKCINSGAEVLELGCGVGLPGILAYLSGGLVTFQDFNEEVLKLVTGPSLWLNTPEKQKHSVFDQCHFLYGDWQQIKNKFYSNDQEKRLFDVILTSETVYEKCNHTKLLDLMKTALKRNGVIYLASKVHYFGVGGSITDFEQLLKDDGTFNFSTVFQTEEGVERRILKLCHKNQDVNQ